MKLTYKCDLNLNTRCICLRSDNKFPNEITTNRKYGSNLKMGGRNPMFTNNLSFGTTTVFTYTNNILKFFVKNFFSAIISGVFSVTSNRRNSNVSQNEMLISLECKYHVRSSCAPRLHGWIYFINIYFHMDFIVNKIYIFFCTWTQTKIFWKTYFVF